MRIAFRSMDATQIQEFLDVKILKDVRVGKVFHDDVVMVGETRFTYY